MSEIAQLKGDEVKVQHVKQVEDQLNDGKTARHAIQKEVDEVKDALVGKEAERANLIKIIKRFRKLTLAFVDKVVEQQKKVCHTNLKVRELEEMIEGTKPRAENAIQAKKAAAETIKVLEITNDVWKKACLDACTKRLLFQETAYEWRRITCALQNEMDFDKKEVA